MPRSFLMKKFNEDKWKARCGDSVIRNSRHGNVIDAAKKDQNEVNDVENNSNTFGVSVEIKLNNDNGATNSNLQKGKSLKFREIKSLNRKDKAFYDFNNNDNHNDQEQLSMEFENHRSTDRVNRDDNLFCVIASVLEQQLEHGNKLQRSTPGLTDVDSSFNSSVASSKCSKKKHPSGVTWSLTPSSSSPSSFLPSSPVPSSLSSIGPSQPKIFKTHNDIRRQIWSPPKDLEPKPILTADNYLKLNEIHHGNPSSRCDGAAAPVSLLPASLFHPQYFNSFHHPSFYFRSMVFDEKLFHRNTNLPSLQQSSFSHLYPLASYQQTNFGNLQIITPPPQALTPPTVNHKLTPENNGDQIKTTSPIKLTNSDSFRKSFPSPVSPSNELEKVPSSIQAKKMPPTAPEVPSLLGQSITSKGANKSDFHGKINTFSIGCYDNDNSENIYQNKGSSNTMHSSKASLESNNRNDPATISRTHSVKRGSTKRSSSFQEGITVGYTYDAFFVSDGRSKRRQQSLLLGSVGNSQPDFSPMESSSSSEHSRPSNGSGSKSGGYQQQFFTIAQHLLGQPGDNRTRYKCSECGKHYATSSNLSRHKQTHRSLDSQQAKRCPHCGKVYVSMPALSMHVLTHDLKYQCRVCQKSFSRPWLLQGHLRSHTGEKPFGCAHCGKAFADRSNLRAHMQTHSSFKLHTCKRCCKSFALKAYLNKHQESACYKDEDAKLDASSSSSSSSNCSKSVAGVFSNAGNSGDSNNASSEIAGSVVGFDGDFYQRMATNFYSANQNGDLANNDVTSSNGDNFQNDNAVDVDLNSTNDPRQTFSSSRSNNDHLTVS